MLYSGRGHGGNREFIHGKSGSEVGTHPGWETRSLLGTTHTHSHPGDIKLTCPQACFGMWEGDGEPGGKPGSVELWGGDATCCTVWENNLMNTGFIDGGAVGNYCCITAQGFPRFDAELILLPAWSFSFSLCLYVGFL